MEFYDETAPVMPRPKPMKVLVLSLPRTGTSSICAALRELGLNPYHFSEISKNNKNKHFETWLKAVRAKYDGVGEPFKGDDFDQLLWNYDAVSDDPCCLFVEELIAAYPDAKVILTTRESEAWLKSMRSFIIEILTWRSYDFLSLFDREFTAPYLALLNRTTRVLSKGQTPYKQSARPALLQSFDAHQELVRRVVPKERLLEFNPKQGWEPLCEFLDMPTPKGDFPHLNSTRDAIQLETELFWARWYWVAQRMGKRMGMIVAVGTALWLSRVAVS
ncbi:hypothetical protein PT974_12486 [Cladobotryum mycophilum]|uniref:NAD dependent epimerase/dehydratase n=1 Tax=Cladobotryum mycophilum TaxID=491253 RepID=A0ABR0S926_9HYPO